MSRLPRRYDRLDVYRLTTFSVVIVIVTVKTRRREISVGSFDMEDDLSDLSLFYFSLLFHFLDLGSVSGLHCHF